MDQGVKRQIGEGVEPGGRAKAPGRLELLQRFVNTWNHELPADWDRLGTPQRARTWLREKQLIATTAAVSAPQAARLRRVREALRGLVIANVTGVQETRSIAHLQTASPPATLTVTIDDDGRSHLRPQPAGIDGAIAALLAVLHEAQLTGDWRRLKGCRQCGYVFYDHSKNRSATWCSMSICGNRNKNRTYYRRRHPSS
jgi:predicted RNA-binding Zn ribbon-like protein